MSPDNPASRDEDRVPETRESSLSGGLSLSKAEVEGPVPLSDKDDGSPLQEEIDSMRRALKRLVESFSRVEALEDQFKLSSAINYTTASLTKFIPHSLRELVRAQQILRDHQPNKFDQSVEQAINEVLKEWGRI